jgi:hypothetical protein
MTKFCCCNERRRSRETFSLVKKEWDETRQTDIIVVAFLNSFQNFKIAKIHWIQSNTECPAHLAMKKIICKSLLIIFFQFIIILLMLYSNLLSKVKLTGCMNLYKNNNNNNNYKTTTTKNKASKLSECQLWWCKYNLATFLTTTTQHMTLKCFNVFLSYLNATK